MNKDLTFKEAFLNVNQWMITTRNGKLFFLVYGGIQNSVMTMWIMWFVGYPIGWIGTGLIFVSTVLASILMAGQKPLFLALAGVQEEVWFRIIPLLIIQSHTLALNLFLTLLLLEIGFYIPGYIAKSVLSGNWKYLLRASNYRLLACNGLHVICLSLTWNFGILGAVAALGFHGFHNFIAMKIWNFLVKEPEVKI